MSSIKTLLSESARLGSCQKRDAFGIQKTPSLSIKPHSEDTVSLGPKNANWKLELNNKPFVLGFPEANK